MCIRDSLHIAGANGQPIFSPGAIESVYTYARGIPRVVNVLCEHTLINAYADQQRPVTASLVDEVAQEFELDCVERATQPTGSLPPETSSVAELLLQDFVRHLDQHGQPASMGAERAEG